MPIKHIVLFQFKADADPDTIKECLAGMRALKDQCLHPTSKAPYIKSLTGGRNNSPEGMDAGMQYAFIAEFESASDRDYYIKSDPAHHAFIGKAMPILEKPIVVDFAEDVY